MGNSVVELPAAFARAPELARDEPPALSDVRTATLAALAAPVAGPPLTGFVEGRRRLTVVVPDATRKVPAELVEAVLDHLGARPCTVRVANGTHRRSSAEEQQAVLGRHFGIVPHGDRSADDAFAHHALEGIDARLDVQAARADALLLIGPVSFHYLAGFGGGGKLVAPGLADRSTAEWVHRACLADEGGRHPRAKPGVLEGNPLQARIEALCAKAPPQYLVCPVLDSHGHPVAIFAGERRETHATACRFLLDHYGVPARKASTVVVSSGGAPYDLDFVQAHKALEMAALCTRPGGTIVWLAQCPEGMPARHRAFLEQHASAASMEAALRKRFDIAGHTVWAARHKAERFAIRAVTLMEPRLVERLGMVWMPDLATALEDADASDALLLPFGARLLPLEG